MPFYDVVIILTVVVVHDLLRPKRNNDFLASFLLIGFRDKRLSTLGVPRCLKIEEHWFKFSKLTLDQK